MANATPKTPQQTIADLRRENRELDDENEDLSTENRKLRNKKNRLQGQLEVKNSLTLGLTVALIIAVIVIVVLSIIVGVSTTNANNLQNQVDTYGWGVQNDCYTSSVSGYQTCVWGN